MNCRLVLRNRRVATCLILGAAVLLAACAHKANKEEEEAARNTIVCRLDGERLMIRLDVGEVRLLMPNGNRISLYQIPSDAGMRYTNGMLELRGKDLNLTLVRNGDPVKLEDCKHYELPKPE
jgi:membrane-bound inhibitor of C-type lysozyme